MPDTYGITAFVSRLLDFVSAWFFCCVISVYALPTALDRMIFYIPRMSRLYRRGEVFFAGVISSLAEALLWICVPAGAYLYLRIFQPCLYLLATESAAACLAWGMCAVHLAHRFLNFDRIVKREFYYVSYMRHIRPEALKRYQDFIGDMDTLDPGGLERLLREDLPYMYRQAALRKRRELADRTE